MHVPSRIESPGKWDSSEKFLPEKIPTGNAVQSRCFRFCSANDIARQN